MEWRKIEGWDAYEVSNAGEVRRGGHAMKPSKSSHGYVDVHLSQNGVSKVVKVHRLVALAFLPPIDGKPEVDHINRDRADNRVENLRWVDRSEQMLNRDYPISSSDHKNVYPFIRGGKIDGYRTKIQRQGVNVFQKWFKTLPEAIAARDDYLLNH